MAILQRFLARRDADAAFRRLVRAMGDNDGHNQLPELARDAEQARERNPYHFGLTFALGVADELIASRQPWDLRTEWLQRAAQAYETAMDLADAGRLDGAELLPEVAPDAWEPGLSIETRASLAAGYRAGLLRAGEFRVRDPARAVRQLHRVVEHLRGYHPAWYYLGEAYLLAGDLDAAEAAWRDGLAHSPGNSTLLDVLAKLPVDRVHQAAKEGDWRRVLSELDRLPGEAMAAAERLTLEGDAYHALGDLDRARRSWEAALAADRHALGVRRRLRRIGV
jgi:predicted negative regulator of RcsB-dependent stress response